MAGVRSGSDPQLSKGKGRARALAQALRFQQAPHFHPNSRPVGWSWHEARGEEDIYRRRPERTFACGEGKGGDRSNRLPRVRSTYWDPPPTFKAFLHVRETDTSEITPVPCCCQVHVNKVL